MATYGIPGFFGKLPCRADFLKQRLPAHFIGVWDSWARQAYLRPDGQTDEPGWLDRYLVSPLWRFYWSAGVCGDSVWVGAFMPSVDSVGRCYPMVVASELPDVWNTPALIAHARSWYRALEEIMLSALEEDADPADFDQLIEQQRLPVPDLASAPRLDARDGGWSFAMPCEGDDAAWFFGLLSRVVRDAHGGYTLWWTDHGDSVDAQGLIYLGLPPGPDASAFLAPASVT